MSLGNSYPDRCSIPNTDIMRGVWTGGGVGANCTKAATDWSRGIKSVVWTATGKYTITFVDSGQQIVGGEPGICSAAGAAKKFINVLRSTYSASAKTVQVEIQIAAGTLTDLAVTDQVMFEFVLVTNKPT